ncbi:MAG TPA: alpha/beta fold hydrolase, partial [Thermoanaerobaculia bacterium]
GRLLAAPVPSSIGPPPPGFEEVHIPSGSGSTLAGWFRPGQRGRGVIVLMHSVRESRLTMLDRAGFLSRAGYSVLLFDFQAHGESSGKHLTFGWLESRDARAAVRYARSRCPGEPLGVIGSSLGGASAILGEQPLGADAVVLEAVYPDVKDAVRNRLRIYLGPMGSPLAPLLLFQFRPWLGISPQDLRPVDHIQDLGAPVLILAGTKDRHTTMAETRRLFEAAKQPKELWLIEGAAHVDLHGFAGDEYEERVLGFFAGRLRNGFQTSPVRGDSM